MFKPISEDYRSIVQWAIEPGCKFEFIDGWSYEDHSSQLKHAYRSGQLEETDISGWIGSNASVISSIKAVKN